MYWRIRTRKSLFVGTLTTSIKSFCLLEYYFTNQEYRFRESESSCERRENRSSWRCSAGGKRMKDINSKTIRELCIPLKNVSINLWRVFLYLSVGVEMYWIILTLLKLFRVFISLFLRLLWSFNAFTGIRFRDTVKT